MSYAKTVFLFYDIIGYVRDLSPTGLRVDLFADSFPATGEQVHTTIISHPDLNLDPFNVLTKVRWGKQDGPMIAVGLEIVGFSSEHGSYTYQKLVQIFEELKTKKA
jgi:hypothetical protein